MKINLSPQRRDDTLTVSKQGDTLTINGTPYDFSDLAEGDLLPKGAVDSPWVVSDITRTGGSLELTLLLPHGKDASEAARFPQPLIDPPDGALELPQ
jgi:hypothetical protein